MLKNSENETSILAIKSYSMVKLYAFMKKATYFFMFKPLKKKIKKKFPIFFQIKKKILKDDFRLRWQVPEP